MSVTPHWPVYNEREARAVDVPFPVNPLFEVRADLFKLGTSPHERSDAGLISLDERYAQYARHKWSWLLAPKGVLLAPDAEAATNAALIEAITLLAAAHPAVLVHRQAGAEGSERPDDPASHGPVVFDALTSGLRLVVDTQEAGGLAAGARLHIESLRSDAGEIAGTLADLPADHLPGAFLSLAIQEDWALMAPTREGFVAQALGVSMPSGWDPAEKLGRALHAIHAPVARGDLLRQVTPNLARAMLERGPYVRYVWTLADEPNLSRHPALPRPREAPTRLDDLWFRCERQTTLALPRSGCALFLIRVFVAPLREVAAAPERRARLVAALRSMPDEVVAYKGIAAMRAVVLREWAGAA